MAAVGLAPLLVALLVAATPLDPIDRLVNQLSADPLWGNGALPSLDLPKTATTTEQVVAEYLKNVRFPTEHPQLWKYRILEIRKVKIRPSLDTFNAVLLDTNYGRQIILIQHDKGREWECWSFGAG